jgi:hypothetical protein
MLRVRRPVNEKRPINVASAGKFVTRERPRHNNASIFGIQTSGRAPKFGPFGSAQSSRTPEVPPIRAKPSLEIDNGVRGNEFKHRLIVKLGAAVMREDGVWRASIFIEGERRWTFCAANTQPRPRLALLLVTTSAFFGVLESNTYRALPLAAGYASAFKSRQPDHYSSQTYSQNNQFLSHSWSQLPGLLREP